MPEIDYFRGRMDMLKEQFDGHVKETNDRFLRLENKIEKGFQESQADREAGNKALGEMIEAVVRKVDENRAALSEQKGAFGLSKWVIELLAVLFGGCLVGVVTHFVQ